MNKLILTLSLLLISTITFGQKRIDGFLGLKFGASKLQVINAAKAKGGSLNLKESEPNLLYFDNVKLGTKVAEALFVKFINGKAFQADFLFLTDPEAKTFENYDEIISDINSVYGIGKVYKKFKQPYEDGDGYELTAVKTGNADYKTFWQDVSTTPTENTIMLSIDTNLVISLSYQDAELVKQAIAVQDEKKRTIFEVVHGGY